MRCGQTRELLGWQISRSGQGDDGSSGVGAGADRALRQLVSCAEVFPAAFGHGLVFTGRAYTRLVRS